MLLEHQCRRRICALGGSGHCLVFGDLGISAMEEKEKNRALVWFLMQRNNNRLEFGPGGRKTGGGGGGG